MLKWIFLVSIK